jgi:hypothetical protein
MVKTAVTGVLFLEPVRTSIPVCLGNYFWLQAGVTAGAK